MRFFYFMLFPALVISGALQNCPMATVRAIIQRAATSTKDPATQMQKHYPNDTVPIQAFSFNFLSDVKGRGQGGGSIRGFTMIRRVLEDIHGGSWGVLIIKNPNMVSQDIHWTIPDHTNDDGSPAFCLAVVNRWQYNIFKTGTVDRPDRVTVVDVVNKIRQQEAKKPKSRILSSDVESRFVD